jgi:Phage integrase SAM-like domain
MIASRDGGTGRRSGRLVPFFGDLGISEITAGKIQDYRIYRHQEAIAKRGKPPGHSTMHQEIVTLREVLKTALRHGWLDRLPDFSEPYRSCPKISHRAWFSPEEYNELYTATRQRNCFTTMCFLQSKPDCDPTRLGA